MYDDLLVRPQEAMGNLFIMLSTSYLLFSIDRCRLSKRTFVVAASYREPRLMHCGIIVKQQSELCGVASSLSTGRIKWHA